MVNTASQWDDITFIWLTDEEQKVVNQSRSKFKTDSFYQLNQSLNTIGIKSIPYTVVINAEGETVYSHSGELAWNSESFKASILDKLN